MVAPKYILILLLTLFTAPILHAQDVSNDNAEYYQDSLLKGGYIISYRTDDSTEYLLLRKNGKAITELSLISKGLLAKNLGYVWADFQNCFVFVNAYGPCNPIEARLINKKDGKNIFKTTVALLDVDKIKGLILYTDDAASLDNIKLILYNIHSGKREIFNCPKDLDASEVYCSVQITKLTDKQLTIKYQGETSGKTKTYKRH